MFQNMGFSIFPSYRSVCFSDRLLTSLLCGFQPMSGVYGGQLIVWKLTAVEGKGGKNEATTF